MPKFRKKPVVIEARQLERGLDRALVVDLGDWCEGFVMDDGTIHIETLEGMMIASVGDWIIKGVKGEFYPCKPAIFDLTYEAVDDERDDE